MTNGFTILTLLLFAFELTLIIASMIRQGRAMIFATIASLILGVISGAALNFEPIIFSAFLKNAGTITLVHAQFLWFMGFLMILGLVLTVALVIFSFFVFRFSFAKRIFFALVDLPRQAFFFALFALLLVFVFPVSLPLSTDNHIQSILHIVSFVFLLQFFLRLVKSARFSFPKDLVAFSFQTGLIMIFFRGIFSTGANFFEELFIFFLGILISGIIGAFLARNAFEHLFFSPHQKHRPFSLGIFSALLLVPKEETFPELRLMTGVLVTFLFAAILLLGQMLSSLLLLLPLFFIAYFFLFAILDHYVLKN